MKTDTAELIEYFITEHGPGLVPDAGTLMTWPPDAVEEELERRVNALHNDDSTPSLFD